MKQVPVVTNCDNLTTEELKAICSAVQKDIQFGMTEDNVLSADYDELSEEYIYYAEALEKRLAEAPQSD